MMERDRWIKPSTSQRGVEVIAGQISVSVKNSDQVHHPLMFTANEWREFVEAVKNGEFDL